MELMIESFHEIDMDLYTRGIPFVHSKKDGNYNPRCIGWEEIDQAILDLMYQ